jgi:hypothetical protein
MASGSTLVYLLPYPLSTDGVDISGDIQDLATSVDSILQAKSGSASPTFTGIPAAPTAAADTSTTQIATTQFVLNQAGSSNPLINGTVAVGTSLRYARQDHVHPTDTTRSPLAGSASITTLGTITTGTWAASTITADRGGTGLTSYTIGDIMYASGATTIAKLAGVATGSALISGGAGAAPSWGKVGLATHISGTLGTGNGGTGLTAFTSGGAMYATSTSVVTTGTLPVASGGTGVTTSTGSGAVVLGTSPTIGTATINTPTISGGTIANATSITLTGAQTLAAYRVRNMYVSTTDPGTGNDGDIWLKY